MVTSVVALYMIPGPNTTGPSVTRPLYRLMYGSRPRRFFHAETRDGIGRFVATVCAAVLISGASKTYRALGLRSENAQDSGRATGTASPLDSSARQSSGCARRQATRAG